MLALALWAEVAWAMPAAERVRFESLDREGGQPVAINALLVRPGGAVPKGGFAAVVALHGCGGLYSSLPGREQTLSERHASHAEALVKAGYVVMFPDSLTSRGLRELCTTRSAQRTVNAAKRRLDALGALRWLATQPDIARDRIALLGWSHGGSTVLAAIDASDATVAALRSEGKTFFRAAIAFYPGCTPSSRSEAWRPAVATRILIGAADDWMPAAPCERLGERARERNWPLEVTVYPDAHHGFDAPRGSVRLRSDVPGGVNPGQGVHVGANPAARSDARRRVDTFLAEALGGEGRSR